MQVEQKASLTYSERALLCSNPVARTLFQLMDRKQSNLCVSVDVESKQELLTITQTIAREICLLKFHVEILEDFDQGFIHQLTQLAEEHDFLIISDSKIGDIGNTAKRLYSKGLYRIVEWADFVTVHPTPGPGVIGALEEASKGYRRGLLLVAQMSSAGTLTNEEYTQASVRMALDHPEIVAGFVCQERITDDPRFLHFTPGVNLESQGDSLGQQFRHPRSLCQQFSDVVAVGRGVYKAQDPKAAAERYRKEGWEGYLTRD